MTTPAQLRIIHLIALAGGNSTEAQIIALTGSNYFNVKYHLRQMQRAGLINRGKGIVWLTARGMNENNLSAAGPDNSVAI